jgi:hypothetical protein
MMQMMPGQGMGAAGTGAGTGPSVQGGVNPQLLAMLMQMQGGAGGMGGMGAPQMPQVAAPPGPIGASPTGTPMAGFIGSGGNMAGQMNHPMGMPQNPAGAGIPGVGANPGQAGAVNPQMLALMQMLKGQQGGVPATGGMPGGNPNPQAGWLQQLLGGGAQPAAPGTGVGAGGMT